MQFSLSRHAAMHGSVGTRRVRALSRGIRTALVEREDFGCGTSSKSTKLVHGGVRYLEKAVFNLDLSQLKLVYEALHVREGGTAEEHCGVKFVHTAIYHRCRSACLSLGTLHTWPTHCPS